MKRTRAVAILIKNDEVLLIHRKNEKEYFTFPGGGVESGETVEEAVIREMKEETTLDITITKLLYRHIYDDDTDQYFYLCEYSGGEPKLGEDSEEKMKMSGGNDYFNPLWVKLNELENMLVYPLEIRDLLLEDYKNDFANPVVTQTIKISEIRQSL